MQNFTNTVFLIPQCQQLIRGEHTVCPETDECTSKRHCNKMATLVSMCLSSKCNTLTNLILRGGQSAMSRLWPCCGPSAVHFLLEIPKGLLPPWGPRQPPSSKVSLTDIIYGTEREQLLWLHLCNNGAFTPDILGVNFSTSESKWAVESGRQSAG